MSNKLFKSTAVVGFFTLLSRILGFLRDIAFARMFGAGTAMEAFLVAFKIPNFMRRLFAEGSFTQAFVPVLAEYKAQHSKEQMKEFIQNVVGTLGAILLVVTALGMIFSGTFILIFAPGFLDDIEKFNLASHLLVVTFPYIFFISLTALAGSILNSFGKFAVPAFTPAILNIVLIAFAYNSSYFTNSIDSIAWGVSFAGFAQLMFQLPFLKKLNLLSIPKWGWNHLGVKKLLKLMVPALFGSSIAQISLLLDTVFASFLMSGSISWLYYADRLNQFPLGVFGIALSTVILPHLSKHHARNCQKSFNKSLDWAFRIVFVIALPAAIGMFCLSSPLLITLFYYGNFSQIDIIQTSIALKAYSFGLFSFIMVKVLISAFYSRQNMKTPVKIGIIAICFNMIMNAILILILIPYNLGHLGLAISTSLSSFINALLLIVYLKKDIAFKLQKGWAMLALRITLSLSAMIFVLEFFQKSTDKWFIMSATDRFLNLFLLIIVAVVMYFILLIILGTKKSHFTAN